MKPFHTFIFEKIYFDTQTLEAHFYYSFDEGKEVFEEIIDFRNGTDTSFEIQGGIGRKIGGEGFGNQILNNFLFQLHLALGMSYYKLFPTEKLVVKTGFLDETQKAFWKKFYQNGLGEFFITNQIDPTELCNFESEISSPSIEELMALKQYIDASAHFIGGKNLLLWGGGKDSIVSYSLLQKDTKILENTDLFVFGKLDQIKRKTAEITEKNIFFVKRTLSPHLFQMNQAGYYNGHVAITGIIAFVTFVVGYLYDYSNIILSNEHSASESNTIWKGLHINHQYSKSLEFEKDLQAYCSSYITQGIHYFSLLRGMYEYKIAETFSTQEKFFPYFSSCNRNFTLTLPSQSKITGKLWCGKCEKCSFVFLILAPFLSPEQMLTIFGENLFEKKELEQTFRELIGATNHKPFECVGTYDESLLAAKKALKHFTLSFSDEVGELCDDEQEKKLENKLSKISNDTIIPPLFHKCIL